MPDPRAISIQGWHPDIIQGWRGLLFFCDDFAIAKINGNMISVLKWNVKRDIEKPFYSRPASISEIIGKMRKNGRE